MRTPSSEQVRRPIYREATDEWRSYERYLGRSRPRSARYSKLIPTPPRPSRNADRIIVTLLSWLPLTTECGLPLCLHSSMGAFHDRSLVPRRIRPVGVDRSCNPGLSAAQTTGQSPTPARATASAAAGGLRAGRDVRPGRNHHHRDQARGESPERSDQRTGAWDEEARSAEHLEFRAIYQQLPSVSFQTAQPGHHNCLYARRRHRRRRQPLGLAAVGRHLSRRAAGDDHRRNARRPHLRHRPDREPRRAAGHALRRVERSGHDPHHHQQARAGRHLPAASTASSTRSLMAASAASSKG